MTKLHYLSGVKDKALKNEMEIIEHTADIGIVARGIDLEQAFARAAEGMFSLIADLEDVTEEHSREVEVKARDEPSLLVEWLSELLYLWETEYLLCKRFEIVELNPHWLKAMVYGSKFDPNRHHLKTAIKAITYHQLQVEKHDGYRLQVIFDV